MIALPVAVLAYLLNSELILINQNDFESLSQISQQMLTNRDKLLVILRCIFPWFAGLFILVGVALLIYGLCKWKEVQKNLDKKLDAETTLQTLNVLKMSPKEIDSKIEEEISESGNHDAGSSTSTSAPSQHIQQNISQKYIELENRYFDNAVSKYGKKYNFTRNVRMGHYTYDFIGVSKRDNIDLLLELKYWIALPSADIIMRVFNRLVDAGVNYETVAHRNFRTILIIVTPENKLSEMNSWIDQVMNNFSNQKGCIFEIKCIPEKSL